MSIRADLSSLDALTRRRGLLALLDRVERLERRQPGILIGETEMGDKVFSVVAAPEDGPRNGVVAAIKERLGM